MIPLMRVDEAPQGRMWVVRNGEDLRSTPNEYQLCMMAK